MTTTPSSADAAGPADAAAIIDPAVAAAGSLCATIAGEQEGGFRAALFHAAQPPS
jgi:hypothetical protein